MPREAKPFTASDGSPVRGFLKLQANIPPRWIDNARSSRKRNEPEIFTALRRLKRLQKNHPRATARIREARQQLRAVLKNWETAYRKESFYRGIRVLLEIKRTGTSEL
jgi:hypothetical protein